MFSLEPDHARAPLEHHEDWHGHHPPAPRHDHGLPLGLVVTGLVVVGLGWMAWSHLGPDLRRYIKMTEM